ncbi:Bub1p related protein kinase [Cryptosporidium ryanae]|uniref:Bub1p related protein kinase n=1 Tax=Cryptosporidium ryanae TaxID=515981 RepID=UPI00351A0CE1|nr:Bub1p related protein kinase [Cryptosporidium ryanae]
MIRELEHEKNKISVNQMNRGYRSFFSFDTNILKVKSPSSHKNFLKQDEFSFEELYYECKVINENGPRRNSFGNKENIEVNLPINNVTNLGLISEFNTKKRLENGRLSLLEPVFDKNVEINEICEEIETININETERSTDEKPICSIEKLESCGKFDKTEDNNVRALSEGRYFLISMFNVPKISSDPRENEYNNQNKMLFKIGDMVTINPYHVRSRSFRESIMLNFINERFLNYHKFNSSTVPYMLHQVNLSSVSIRDDLPKLSQSYYKSGYTFTLEISDTHKRTCVLKDVIGCGANASVFSADICTIINNEVAGVFSCAVKVQHRDLGLNIRELYCGMALYKRNKKRTTEKQFDYIICKDFSNTEDLNVENSKNHSLLYNKLVCDVTGKNLPNFQKTARSSISTNFPQSNFNSCRNSINSVVSVSENSYRGSYNSLVSQRNSISSRTISNIGNPNRLSTCSNYSFNYLESPSDGSILTDPIVINEGITVFCITELFIVSSSTSGMIQNILNRETIKGSIQIQNCNDNRDDVGKSVGISILPTSPGSKSLQKILNEHYLKSGLTMEEPVVLFLVFQFSEVLLAFNDMKIIHGDIKPDNILLYPNLDFELKQDEYDSNEKYSHPLMPEGHSLPLHTSIIDLGRSLDIGEIYKNTLFEGNCHAKNFLPPVMLENLPWLHHIDIFGIASTVHCLITGRYMELTKWKNEILKCTGSIFEDSIREDHTLDVYNYKIKNQSSCIKRSWNYEFWNSFMSTCINFCPILLSSEVNMNLNDNSQNNTSLYDSTPEGPQLNVTIEELSQNTHSFLKKVQKDIISIFNSSPQMKIDLYKQLLNIRKFIGSTSVGT